MNTDTLSEILGFSIGTITLEKVFYILLLIVICYIVSKIILNILRKIVNQSPLDQSIKTFIITGAKILLAILSVLSVTEYLGIPMTSIIAMLSVVSLAISLSVQGILTNVFSGMTILLAKPFGVGDYVELDNLSGTVTETGLIYTKLLTPDNKTVFLPNSQVCDGRIVNYTSQTERRIEIFVSAAYDTPIDDVRYALCEALKAYPQLNQEPAPLVRVKNYLDSSIQYVIHAWVPTDLYWDAYYTIMAEIKHSFDRHGIAMDYPHMNIHMIGDKK